MLQMMSEARHAQCYIRCASNARDGAAVLLFVLCDCIVQGVAFGAFLIHRSLSMRSADVLAERQQDAPESGARLRAARCAVVPDASIARHARHTRVSLAHRKMR